MVLNLELNRKTNQPHFFYECKWAVNGLFYLFLNHANTIDFLFLIKLLNCL